MPGVLSRSLRSSTTEHYDDGFRRMIEDHLPYLQLTNSTGGVIVVDGATAIKYKGDFFGLMRFLGIDMPSWWPMMRLNNMNSPFDYHADMTIIKAVNPDYISKLLQTYRTSQAKKA